MSAGRLARWLSPVPASRAAGRLPGDAVAAVRARRFEEVGEFLVRHALEPGDRNYALARAYLAGEQPVAGAVAALLRSPGGVTEAGLEGVHDALRGAAEDKGYDGGDEGGTLAAVAERLAVQMNVCLRAAGRFDTPARALALAFEGEAGDPAATLARLAALTGELAQAARLADAELSRARDEVEGLRHSLEDARRAAGRDHLTGLVNRRGFEEALARRAAAGGGAGAGAGGGENGCVAMCDLDRFKQVNDDHGHAAGDRVLRHFAGRLRAATAGRALVARYGGEEFVCLFPELDAAAARDVLDALRRALGGRALVNRDTGRPMAPLTFSAGVAPLGGRPATAVQRADKALYAAKRAGRDRVVIAAG